MSDLPVIIEERHVAVEGCGLHVRWGGTAGDLPVIVLEAGGGSTLPTWSGVERALAAHTRVLSYERAGIGQSSGPVDSVRAPAVAQRLDGLLQVLDIHAPVILAGHSLGGLYSRYYAATRPQKIAGLVLLDTTPENLPFPRHYSLLPRVLAWTLHGLIRTGLAKLLMGRQRADAAAEQIESLGRAQHVRTVLQEIDALREIQSDVTALPPAAPLPTLTISAGAKSAKVKAEQFELFRSSHEQLAAAGKPPYSRHVRMEGAMHMSMLTDPRHAETVANSILQFARQLTPPR